MWKLFVNLLLFGAVPANAQFKAPDSFRRLVQDGPSAAGSFGGMSQGPNGQLPDQPGGYQPPILPNMALGDAPPAGLSPDQKMGFWFQKIMAYMQMFEGIKPRFAQIRTPPPNADANTQRILSGQASEEFHVEFLRLQQTAMTLVDEQSNAFKSNVTPDQLERYLSDLENYAKNLGVHISEVQAALDSALTTPGGANNQNRGPAGGSLGGGGAFGGGNAPAPSAGGGGVGIGVPIQLPQQGQNNVNTGAGAPRGVAVGSAIPVTPSQGSANRNIKQYQRVAGDGSMFPDASGQERLAQAPNAQQLHQQVFGGGVATNPLDLLLAEIQQGMAQFELLKPLFARVPPALPAGVTDAERRLLQGLTSEEINRRFLALQQRALQVSDPQTGLIKDKRMETEFLGETQQYLQDMKAHIKEAQATFTKIGLEPAGGFPAPPPPTGGMPGGGMGGGPVAPEVQALNALFQEIQTEMQKFEVLAPRFSGVPPAVLAQITDFQEKQLITGQASEGLHRRFLAIQQQAQTMTGNVPPTYLEEVKSFLRDLQQHILAVGSVMDKHNVQAPAGLTYAQMQAQQQQQRGVGGGIGGAGIGGGSMQGTPINPNASPPPQQQQMGGGMYGGAMGGANNMVNRPSGFGGGMQPGKPGAQAGAGDPTSNAINALFEKVETHMGKFETVLKPLFKNVPPPTVLQGKMEASEIKIASGQASEHLHRRFLAIQQRVQGLDRAGAPMVQAFIQDLTQFESDLAAHVVEAESTLIKASKISTGSTEAYKGNQNPTLTVDQLEQELTKVVEDVTQVDERLGPVLKKLRKRMKKQMSRLADPQAIRVEINKLAHMMDSMKSGILGAVKQIRDNYNKVPIDALNHIYWNELGMDVQRYLGTMRDMDKEELQAQQQRMQKQNKNSGGANDAAAANIDMPSMKLTGVLGTTGATNLNRNAGETNYMQRGMSTGSMAAGAGQNAGAVPQQGGMGGLNGLPKLDLQNLEL